jgi:putative ABC transport system permease protein
MEGFYLLEGHALTARAKSSDETATPSTPDPTIPAVGYDHDGNPVTPLPEAQREVTSLLVKCPSATASMVLNTAINKSGSATQAVAPAEVVSSLLENIVGPVRVVLLVLTALIVLVAAIGILVSIYNSMSERAHDIAVMRALGASRGAVQTIVLLEAVLLALLGGLAGMLLGHLMIGIASPYVEARTGVTIDMLAFDPWELVVIPALLLLAVLAGVLPAITAYRTDVAKALSGTR